MRRTDQKKYLEALKRFERKFTSEELKEFKMFQKRHKDDEDLDNISFQKLKTLYNNYCINIDKPDINDLFREK